MNLRPYKDKILNVYLVESTVKSGKFINFLLKNVKAVIPFVTNKDPIPVDMESQTLLVNPRSTDLATIFDIYEDECYQPLLQEGKTEYDTILDIGANIGVFSLWALKNLEPKRIVAVEASRANYQLLEKNLEKTDKEVVLINKALFSTNGSINLKTPKKFRGSCTQITTERGEEKIETLTLKKLIKEENLKVVDLLKMDIESAEKYILTDKNTNIFRNRIKYIVLEAHKQNGYRPEMALKYLENAGFKVSYNEVALPTGYKHNWIINGKNKNLL